MCALEAMYLGTPVVSTPSDGMRDLISDGVDGYLHQHDEVLAQKLLKILREPEHRAFLSANEKQRFAQINDAQAYCRTIADCYRRGVGEK